MSDYRAAACNRDGRLENLAAEFTVAAYRFTLKYGTADAWIEVELSLWRTLVETVKKWVRQRPPVGFLVEFKTWREGFLLDLTKSAFDVAVKHGIKGSLLDVEFGLHRRFRLMIGRHYGTR